jgi:hypothetical protein
MIMAKLAWLISLWKTAKADSSKFSNVEQLRTFVIEAIQQHYVNVKDLKLDRNDGARFSASINGQSVSGDVTNLYGYISSYQDEDPRGLVDRYVRGLELQRVLTEDNLMVVVRTTDYVDSVAQQINGVVSERLIGELNIVYMIDSPETMSPLKTDEMIGKTLPELQAVAYANVRKWLPNIKVDKSIAPIILYYVEDNTMLSSSLILLDEFWVSVESTVSSDVYFALPRRDQLFILDAKFQNAIPKLRKLIVITEQDGFNLLSNRLYRRREGKLELA